MGERSAGLTLRRPVFLTAWWRNLVILNYEVDPEILAPFVPRGIELDSWQGKTLVSVVGFEFADVRIPGTPIPFHRDFAEINLRFYVRRRTADGSRRGVVFVRELVPLPSRFPGAPALRRAIQDPAHGAVVPEPPQAARVAGCASQRTCDHSSLLEYVVEHPTWRYWNALKTRFDCNTNALRALDGGAFAPYLKSPFSAYLVEGSPVRVLRPRVVT